MKKEVDLMVGAGLMAAALLLVFVLVRLIG